MGAKVWLATRAVCRYDTIVNMDTLNRRAFLAALGCGAPLAAAQGEDAVTVATDHPRLFLRPARLRLLRRERERASPRWQQFEALVAGAAPLPERPFALALYYQISGDKEAGRQALGSLADPAADPRQFALLFDWCQDLLSETETRDMAARLEKSMAATAGDDAVAAVRSRIMAAVALFDHVPAAPQRELERTVRAWWPARFVAGLTGAGGGATRDEAYPLFELLHAVRDNTMLDLRESSPRFLKDLPIQHLLSYYPAAYRAPENDFYIGATRLPGPPDLRRAALSRAAELAMVAYDTNALESQLLQGWLMHDDFMLRGPFGAPYEFLWANPYQPGLSYDHAPLVYHDPATGRLFARSNWDDSARWFGYFEGAAQIFDSGRVTTLNPRQAVPALSLGSAAICFGSGSPKFRIALGSEQPVFLVGLEPRRAYQVEVDGQEMFETAADTGGILELSLPKMRETGIRVRPAPRPPATGG